MFMKKKSKRVYILLFLIVVFLIILSFSLISITGNAIKFINKCSKDSDCGISKTTFTCSQNQSCKTITIPKCSISSFSNKCSSLTSKQCITCRDGCNTLTKECNNLSNSDLNAPIQISNCKDLQNKLSSSNRSFVLINDIDCSETRSWNNGSGFIPGSEFTGSLDGRGFSISNLYINRKTGHTGLIGYTRGDVTISNLNLLNISFFGNSQSGAFVGYAGPLENGSGSLPITIINCSVTGKITGNNFLGGFVGNGYVGKIVNSHFDGQVRGIGNWSENIGGLVGGGFSGISIINSSASGSVSGKSYIGGLIGKVNSYSFYIENSSFVGNVTAEAQGEIYGDSAGGLVGDGGGAILNSFFNGKISGRMDIGGFIGNIGSPQVNITSSYVVGSLEATGYGHVGGFIGYGSGSLIQISDSYTNVNLTGENYLGGFIGYGLHSKVISSYSLVNLKGQRYIGGIVGDGSGDAISNSFVMGSISGVEYFGHISYPHSISVSNSYALVNLSNSTDAFYSYALRSGLNNSTLVESANYFKGEVINRQPFILWSFGDNKKWKTVSISNCGFDGLPILAWQPDCFRV